ncbi:MAG: MoaD/ThiS family protein [Chloroflexota bacterium]
MRMGVEVHIPQFLEHVTGNVRQIYVAGQTVGECLGYLVKRFPGLQTRLFTGDGKLRGELDVCVNGISAYPEELAKPVSEGDRIDIMYIIIGG